MSTERMTQLAVRGLCVCAWLVMSTNPMEAAAQAPAEIDNPAAPCREATHERLRSCELSPGPVAAPGTTPEEWPSDMQPDHTVPAEPVICACLFIEDIDPLDAVVQRGRGHSHSMCAEA